MRVLDVGSGAGDVLRLDLEGFDAVVGQDGVQLLPAIVGAWAHS
jgi:hypothetical protein